MFRPAVGSEGVLQRLQGLETLGARWLPLAGTAWVVLARKRVLPLTPIKPRWKPRRSFAGAQLAERNGLRRGVTDGTSTTG